jgi:membrane glycosyltransferase
VLAGLVLSIPLAMVTSSESLGRWALARRLFLIPEETHTPRVLQNLDGDENSPRDLLTGIPHAGLLRLFLSPEFNALHCALLKRSRVKTRHKETYLEGICERLLADGPSGLTKRELSALLWDAKSVETLHREVWSRESRNLAPWWQYGIRFFEEPSPL